MERILIAIDAVHTDRNSVAFACYLGRLTKSKITGIFLENIVAEEKPVLRTFAGRPYFDWEVNEESEQHQEKMMVIDSNINLFKETCINEAVQYEVVRKAGVPEREIEEESRFADLIVVSSETSFEKRYEGCPSHFAKGVLKNVECPVIISPNRFNGINEIVLAYDGSSSSMYAIKQFAYLFPQYSDHKVTVHTVNETGVWEEDVHELFCLWIKCHYSSVSFNSLKGDAASALFDQLVTKDNFILVMGAYGRHAVSQFFAHSKAEVLINTLCQSVFVAH